MRIMIWILFRITYWKSIVIIIKIERVLIIITVLSKNKIIIKKNRGKNNKIITMKKTIWLLIRTLGWIMHINKQSKKISRNKRLSNNKSINIRIKEKTYKLRRSKKNNRIY